MTLKQAPRRVSERFDRRVTGKYEIEALIGKSSFSRVVRARLRGAAGEAASEAFAIKVVPADDASSGPFANELQILSSLRHPFVIRLHEAFRSTAKFYLVLEEATGGELYDKIVKYGTLSEQTSVTTTRMLLSGLQYLHRVGVTHRDLKPENLLFIQPTDDSRLVISDFGLAHQQQPGEPSERMVDTCGTPEYIAPEVLLRLPYTNKVDIWSLGVIVYIILSGVMPFDDDSRNRLYRLIIRGQYVFYPELWESVSCEAKGFVAALLEMNPYERLSAEEALCHPWITGQHSPTRSQFRAADAIGPPLQRTRSGRSTRSVPRSDQGRRVRGAEVEQLARDPDVQRLVTAHPTHSTHHYGLV